MSNYQYRRGRHSVTDLKVHLICVQKYRDCGFTAEGISVIHDAFLSVAKKMNFEILEFNGEVDHIHALIEYPPTLSVSKITKHLKGVSSRLYRQRYETRAEGHLWSPSYFAVSVGGAPLEDLKEYIRNQKKPD